MPLTPEQYEVLMKPLNGSRVAKRNQGGKQLSYLEAYDVRAHLIRVFGFGNFDVETLDYRLMSERPYTKDGKDMVEIAFSAHVRLTVRDTDGETLSVNSEVAIGSASGPAFLWGELADNAVKTAVSDAMKRCAISWGTAFGLSLYNNGSTNEVVRGTIVKPEGYVKPEPDEEKIAQLKESLGATEIESNPNEDLNR